MTLSQEILTIALCSVATILTRALPFLIFSGGNPPRYIRYLGKALPAAIFGMLVVYCLKGIELLSAPHGLPELIGVAIVVALHLWRRNMLLSIAAGTLCYMLLIQFVF